MTLRLNRPARTPYGSETRGFARESYLEDLAEILPDAKVVFDVGAHDGGSAVEFLRIFPQANVYSFEPSPRTFPILQVRAQNLPRLIIENMAVSDAVDRLTFHEYANAAGDFSLPVDPRAFVQVPVGLEGTATADVTAITLDVYCASQGIDSIDLLKLDIQGGELRALKGAINLLKSGKVKAIFTEVDFIPLYVGQSEFHEIQAFLLGCNYRVFDFYNFSYGENGQLRWGDALFLPTG